MTVEAHLGHWRLQGWVESVIHCEFNLEWPHFWRWTARTWWEERTMKQKTGKRKIKERLHGPGFGLSGVSLPCLLQLIHVRYPITHLSSCSFQVSSTSHFPPCPSSSCLLLTPFSHAVDKTRVRPVYLCEPGWNPCRWRENSYHSFSRWYCGRLD